jgi:5-methylcytosine-specific restriction protein A
MAQRIRGRKLQRIRHRRLSAEPLCVSCLEFGNIRAATQVDHIIPLFRGGSDTEENRQNLCDDCHHAKSLQERGCIKSGCDETGVPLSSSHPWRASILTRSDAPEGQDGVGVVNR